MKKITQIMISKGFGGAERLYIDICLELAKQGYKIQAICHPDFCQKKKLVHNNIEISYFKTHYAWNPIASIKLKKILSSFKPEIIHCHLARASAIGGNTAKKLNIPITANIHNYVKLKYYKKIQHFFPGTKDQQKYLMNRGIPENAITIIPHFSRFEIIEEKTDENYFKTNPTILSYGRFVKKKGFNILLESLYLLHKNGLKVKLILGGDGSEKKKLKKQIKQYNLENFVEMQGWIKDVKKFLKQSPFFILPSLSEPFGIVILEAMASKKIIISTNIEGPKEILDSSTAYLVSVNDPIELANNIKKALTNRKVSMQKAKKAQQVYKKKYTIENIIPIYVKAYKHIIKKTNEKF